MELDLDLVLELELELELDTERRADCRRRGEGEHPRNRLLRDSIIIGDRCREYACRGSTSKKKRRSSRERMNWNRNCWTILIMHCLCS